MINDLPLPLTPSGCNLQGFPFMPLHGHRLYGSDFDAHATDAEWRAAHSLWWAAWNQIPAASMPDDDVILCRHAGFGRDMRAWLKVKKMALDGFIKCSDGRLYHQFLAGVAVHSFDRRLKADTKRSGDRDRLRAWREGRKTTAVKGGREVGLYVEGNGPEGDCETQSDTLGETRFTDQTLKCVSSGVKEEKPRVEKIACSTKLPSWPATVDLRASRAESEFKEFWDAYPRPVAKLLARKAWEKARKRATHEQILAGVKTAQWSDDPKYIPHPGTWLAQGRWQDEVPTTPPAAPERDWGPRGAPPCPDCIWSHAGARWLTPAEIRQCST